MREIKFRVWDSYHRCFLKNQNGTYIEDIDFVFQNGSSFNPKSEYLIQQFTGLTDKNCVDIYEGDIVEDEEHYYSLISWDNDNSMYVASDVGGLCDMNFPIKIIGNIHENPELLEQV